MPTLPLSMRAPWKSFSVACLLVTFVALGAGSIARAATASPAWTVTMFSEPGDYIGGGTAREFDSTNATVSGTPLTSGVSLSLNGGTTGSNFSMDITPPPSQTFTVGYYTGVQRSPFRTAGHPGLDIYGDGRGCNTDSGAFEVRDLAASSGTITRLDLLYEQHCEGGPAALFGEVRLNEPHTSGVIISSGSITWPAVAVGGSGIPVPVYLRNTTTAAVSMGSVHLGGSDPGSFRVVLDECSAQTVAAGASCLLDVSFPPSPAAGPVTAVLQLPINAKVSTVQLDGDVLPGKTSLTMRSDSGDYIGAGGTYNFTPANASISFSGSQSVVEMDVSAADGEYWTVDLAAASGTILVPGTYRNATRYPFNGSGNGLSVYGDGRGCNTVTGSFTVTQAVYSAVDGSLQHFDATFVQHCEGATPALRGDVKWLSEASTTAPPDVTSLAATPSGKRVDLTWQNPTTSTYAYTVIRVQAFDPLSPMAFTGTAVFSGTESAATLHGLKHGVQYTVSAFTVDTFGNVSPAETLSVTGP